MKSNQTSAVEEFMVKQQQARGYRLEAITKEEVSVLMLHFGELVADIGAALEDIAVRHKDLRALRAHLVTEECAELIRGLALNSRLETLDALGDLLYVVFGAGIAFGLPLDEAFERIHASNMTKNVRDRNDPRVRNKGADYVPPKLEELL